MSLDNFNLNPALLPSADNKMIYLPDFKVNEFIEIEPPFYMNLSSKSSEEDDFNFFNYADSSTLIPSILDPNPMPSLEDILPIQSIESGSKKDSLIILKKVNLFTNKEKNSLLFKKLRKPSLSSFIYNSLFSNISLNVILNSSLFLF